MTSAMTIREWPCQVTCSLAGPGSAQQVQGWQRIDNMCLKHGHAANPEVLGKLENKQLLLEGKWYQVQLEEDQRLGQRKLGLVMSRKQKSAKFEVVELFVVELGLLEGKPKRSKDQSTYKVRERASLVAQKVKNLPAMQETWVLSLGQKDPLEKGISIHSSIITYKIPWTEEPSGLKSMRSQRVRHD